MDQNLNEVSSDLVEWVQLQTNTKSPFVKWVYFCVLVVGLPVTGILIKMALQKINQIKDPKTNNSYCVISLYILYQVIFNLVL